MRQRVLQELNRIEREHSVRILLAVESGSRAWGFASPDSDYDVRFVYAHERDFYLSVFENRDVIEEMLPDRLDINGWDLRKSLRLFSKCNLALNEWLGSPIVYLEVPRFRDRLVRMIPRYFNPIGAMHHYRSMADRAIAEHLTAGRAGGQRPLRVRGHHQRQRVQAARRRERDVQQLLGRQLRKPDRHRLAHLHRHRPLHATGYV